MESFVECFRVSLKFPLVKPRHNEKDAAHPFASAAEASPTAAAAAK